MSVCDMGCAEALAALVLGIGFAAAILAGLLAWLMSWAVKAFEDGMAEFERVMSEAPPMGVRVVLTLDAKGPRVAANVTEAHRIEEALTEGGVLPPATRRTYRTTSDGVSLTFTYEDTP